MHCFSKCRVFQAAAVLGLVLTSYFMAAWLARAPQSTIKADEQPQKSTQERDGRVSAVPSYSAQQTKQNVRVTLLGLSKGVAFLESQEPAANGGREHGNNAVTWVRAAVLVEGLGDNSQLFTSWSVELLGADGEKLVDTINCEIVVNGKPKVLTTRAGDVVKVALPDPRANNSPLANTIFPVAPPSVEKPEQSKVIIVTQSGRIRETPTATLSLHIGAKEAPQEFLFENIPMP